MTDSIDYRDVRVWVNSEDRDGKLAFAGDRLLGVFVRLNDADGEPGKWFLEAGFGPASTPTPPTFGDLEDAAAWIEDKIALSGRKF